MAGLRKMGGNMATVSRAALLGGEIRHPEARPT